MTSPTYRFPTAAQVMRLYSQCIGLPVPTQPAMLASALYSPIRHEQYGQTDLFQLAGLLASKVILNHSYQDGNKRTALYAADMFLKMNGYRLETKPMGTEDAQRNQEIALAQVSAATTQWSSEDLGAYFAKIATPSANADDASDTLDSTEEH
ncbi:hypothetical protein ARSEF1564_010067 [Beauveria bassiana]